MHPIRSRTKPTLPRLRYDLTWFARNCGGQPSLFLPMFGPGRAGEVNDFSLRRLDGTITGATWASTAGGMGLKFTGSTSAPPAGTFVKVNSDLGAPSTIGVGCWIYLNSITHAGICASGPINTQPRFALTLTASGQLDIYRGSDTTSTATIPAKTLTHIYADNDGAHTRYFVNGVLSNTVSQSAASAAQSVFYIGSNFWGPIDGYMLNFVVFQDRLLSPAQIFTLYREPWGMFARLSLFVAQAARRGYVIDNALSFIGQ